jgi:hypothetical protein
VFLASCVSTSSVMSSWVGKPESELLSSWGSPDSSRRLDDGRVVHTWTTMWNDQYSVHTCRQTFTVSSTGTVERWSHNGCSRWQRKL